MRRGGDCHVFHPLWISPVYAMYFSSLCRHVSQMISEVSREALTEAALNRYNTNSPSHTGSTAHTKSPSHTPAATTSAPTTTSAAASFFARYDALTPQHHIQHPRMRFIWTTSITCPTEVLLHTTVHVKTPLKHNSATYKNCVCWWGLDVDFGEIYKQWDGL